MKVWKHESTILSCAYSFFSYATLFRSKPFNEKGRRCLNEDDRHVARGLCRFLTPLVLIGWLTPAVEAATYYVSLAGNDTSLGTSTAPFRTVKKGISILNPGDTLIIRAGTYTEGLEYYNRIPSGLDDAHRTVIKAAPGETVVLNGRNASGDVWTIYDRSYITIDGITIDAANAYYTGLRIGRSAAGAPGSHYITVQNGTVRNAQRSCITAQGTPFDNSYIKFINLDVHHCGTSTNNQEHGIYLAMRDSLVDRCRIHDASSYGIHAYSSSGGVNNNVIRNNRIYNNGSFGIILSAGYNNLAYNNIVWGNGKRVWTGGIFVAYGGVTGSKIFNNTIYGNAGYCAWIMNGSNQAINNICWKNTTNTILDSTKLASLSRNLFTEPYFVNPAGLDFSLSSSSPAVNQGLALYEVPNDINGVARPQRGAYDIGAYERP